MSRQQMKMVRGADEDGQATSWYMTAAASVTLLVYVVLMTMNVPPLHALGLLMGGLYLIRQLPAWRFLRRWREVLITFTALLCWMLFRDSAYSPALTLMALMAGVMALLGLLATAEHFRGERWWRVVLLACAVVGGGLLLGLKPGELALAFMSPEAVWQRGLSSFTYYTVLASKIGLLAVLLSMACLSGYARNVWVVLATAAAWYFLVLNGAASGIVSAVAAVVFYALLPHRRAMIFMVGASLLALLVLTVSQPDGLNVTRWLNHRDVIYRAAWPHLQEHFLLGTSKWYFTEHIAFTWPWGQPADKYHCAYLEFVLAYGLVGAGLLVMLSVSILRLALATVSVQAIQRVSPLVVFYLVTALVDFWPLWLSMQLAFMGVALPFWCVWHAMSVGNPPATLCRRS